MSGERPDWLRTVDERILRYFEANPPDYVPPMAHRLDVHPGYAERRTSLLVARGLLEPVTDEPVYAVTARGRRVLERCERAAAADD